MAQKIMTENYERKLSPSILSRQKVMTYRNTSYLKSAKQTISKKKITSDN